MDLNECRRSHPIRSAIYSLALQGMFRLEPETIHALMTRAFSLLQRMPIVHRAVEKTWAVHEDVLEQNVFGVRFPRPLGLAAGFDKSATSPDVWAPLGFGFVELGTVTADGQPGNPQPRLFRLQRDHAILNRMGFNNEGAVACARRISRRRSSDVIAVNLGKTKKTQIEEAPEDYRLSARLLGHHADFVVINVSSPNTPGLRDLQAVDSLEPIVDAVVDEVDGVPVLVKIAPDLCDDDIRAVADLARAKGLAGLVATNTTISRDFLATPSSVVDAMGPGGVSGRPVAARSVEVLRLLRKHVGDSLVLVSVGGIETPQQAWERIGAGASLLEGYTGFIYGGPDWIRDIHRGLADQVRRHGLASITEAVGKELPWLPASHD
ncbi:quinone-dependent dihydroorotate dehydrogenase [Corynebacterium kroppenstedtii]|uniref:quinone-dependent dihydroorotate dehydrogenase n=1 Tax=Corynebacterium sp. PCR 32 TaxID=3351342 RepID=UPI0030AE2BDD